ncbi:MAG: serine hydrolase, partial [bacterium]
MTIRHLLTHTSGIPNYTDDPEIVFMRLKSLTPEDIINRFRNRPLEFEPGTSFRYSNSGYVLLGKIIEMVSGQSYEAFLHRRILKPAGMLSTGYGRRESGIPDRADGYTIDQIGNIISALPIDISIMFSAGALYSTVLDIYRWDSLLYTDAILNRATIAEMFTPSQQNYGYGWYIDSLFERRLAFHGGFLDGYNAVLYRWLDDSVTVIVFSNEDEAPVAKIARGLSAIVFDEPYEKPIRRKATRTDSKKLREYAGVYKYEDDTYQYISLNKDTLYTHFRGMPRQVLLPLSRDNFFYASDN